MNERSGPREGRPNDTRCNHATASVDIVAPEGDEYARGFVAGWADRSEYARRTGLTFDDGVLFGWEAAHRAMRNTIAEVTQGMPHDAAEVVRQLVRVWDRGVA